MEKEKEKKVQFWVKSWFKTGKCAYSCCPQAVALELYQELVDQSWGQITCTLPPYPLINNRKKKQVKVLLTDS